MKEPVKKWLYLPDFLCRMKDGSHLLLEVKGQENDQTQAKHQGARRWVEAVNNWGQMGQWQFHVCREPARLLEQLNALTPPTAAATRVDDV